MRLISLQSGSNGNCIYVEAGDTKLLFDAGISGIQAERRLASCGVDIRTVDALLLSHDHSDHSRSAGIFSRKYGHLVYMTDKTYAAAGAERRFGTITGRHSFRAGQPLTFGDVIVETVPTPHDGADGVVFVVEHGGQRLGVMTDLGHPFDGLAEVLGSLDGVLLESNYDPDMLQNGPYPAYLKRRIAGEGGHLSNREAASLLAAAFGSRLQWALLGHLSEENNTADAALSTHRNLLGQGANLIVASRYEVGTALYIE